MVMKQQKVVGHLIVSTLQQDAEKSEAAILEHASARDMGQVHFTTEIVSGATSWKSRKLAQVLASLQSLTNKDVKVCSVKENFQLNGLGKQSKIMTPYIRCHHA